MLSYIACMGHIFADLKCESFGFLFRSIKSSHLGVVIADETDHVLQSEGIHTKVSFVVTDNASNMKKAFEVVNDMKTDGAEDLHKENTLDIDQDVLDDDMLWDDLSPEDALKVQSCLIAMALSEHLALHINCSRWLKMVSTK